jgi:hypothetical protein
MLIPFLYSKQIIWSLHIQLGIYSSYPCQIQCFFYQRDTLPILYRLAIYLSIINAEWYPSPSVFANSTGSAYRHDDCLINPLDKFSSSHSFTTTNSTLDIEYNGHHVGISQFITRTWWLIPGRRGGNLSANTLLHSRGNSWYCSGTISSKGPSFKSFASIALLISYRDALKTLSFPVLIVRKKEARLSITIFPWHGLRGLIFGSTVSLTCYSGPGGSSVTSWTVTDVSWQCVMQYHDPNLTVFDAIHMAT